MKIYVARPISGGSYEEVVAYYTWVRMYLERLGYEVLCPMTAKGYLRTEIKFKASGYNNPVSTNHAIVERDKWMVSQADVVACDLTGATIVSIGSVMELAWAMMLGKHVVLAMGPDNIHRHAFVLEAADIIFDTKDEMYDYLRYLISGSIDE